MRKDILEGKLKIALGQVAPVKGEVENNYKLIEETIRESKNQGADVVVLPETWNTFYYPKNIDELADVDGARSKEFLSKLAKDLDINIIGGSVAVKEDGKIYNRNYNFDRKGNLLSEYDKIHLYSPAGEDKLFQGGNKYATFQIDEVKCGVVLCYDVRFVEWVRKFALDGIEILFNCASWATSKLPHWEALNRARAIENQIFVVGVNSTRYKDDSGGHSMIVDPLGEYIVAPYEKTGIVTAEIDLKKVKEIREEMSFFADRRSDLY